MMRNGLEVALIIMSIWPIPIVNAEFVEQRIYELRESIYEGKCHKAAALATIYLESEPRSEDALQILGTAHYLLNNYSSAVAAWKIAVELDPGDAGLARFLERAETASIVGERPIRKLILDLESEKREERLNAEVRLSRATRDMIFELVANSTDTNVAVRSGIAKTLGSIVGPPDVIRSQSVPSLLRALTDKEPIVRVNAAHSLGRVGFALDESVPALERRMKDWNLEVRNAAIQALALIKQAKIDKIKLRKPICPDSEFH